MPVMKTCRSCAHNGNCEKQSDLSDRMAGLQLLTVTHRCPDRTNTYRPGDAVWVYVYDGPADPESAFHGDDSRTLDWFPGTFIENCRPNVSGRVFVAQDAVSEGPGDYSFEPVKGGSFAVCRIPWARIKRRDATAQPLCGLCGLPGSEMIDDRCYSPGAGLCARTQAARQMSEKEKR
jgi:hypothetical protein